MHPAATIRFCNRAASAALFALCLFSASCTVTERQVAQQGGRIDDLQEQILRLERALAENSGGAQALSADPQLARRLADLGQQVEELSAQLRTVEGRLYAVEQRPASATASVGGAALAQLEENLSSLSLRVAELEAGTTPARRPTEPAPQAPRATPVAAPRGDGQQLYDQGYAFYKQGRYQEAREVFRRYVEENPDTKLTDNALFWIGECHYDQAHYEQAILEYDKVIQQFPRGDKVPSALLKQAFAFDAIGDPVDAKILLRKVLREHPDSEQAAIAKKKLEILGE